jgi:hypothetical protein
VIILNIERRISQMLIADSWMFDIQQMLGMLKAFYAHGKINVKIAG